MAGRKIKVRSASSYPFPQADCLHKVIDTVDFMCHGPCDEEAIAEEFDFHQRQARYYLDAAAYLGLAQFIGGYWRPTIEGKELTDIADESAKISTIAEKVVTLPVFREIVPVLRETGEMEEQDTISEMIRAEDPNVNAVTSSRRTQTVVSWIDEIQEACPQMLGYISSKENDARAFA